MRPAGEAVGVPQRKLYLVDPIDEPFASQKWYYRTARSLQESQIMSPDHDLYTQLPPIGDRGSLEHHVDRKARENPQNQKRRVSVSGPFYLNPGLSLDSSSTGSVIHHEISGTIQGAHRYKSTRELKINPGRDLQENSAADQTRSRHSIASISPSANNDADPGPITMGVANTVLLPSPGNHRRNRNNGRHAGLSGQFAGLRANDDGGSLQGAATDEDDQAPLIAPQPRPANTLYQHDNIQFGYGLSSSPIPDDDASVLSTVDGEFVRSGLAAAPREQRARPVAPPTTPEQTQTFTSNIQQTPGSPLDGVTYPVMTPGSHNLPVIEPGDRSGLSPERADDMSPYKSPEKNVASGFSPEKDESPEKQAGSTLLPAENIACGLSPDRVESPATAASSRVPSGVVRGSPFNQMQGSRMLGPMSLSISRQRSHVGHGASNSGSIPSSPGLVEVGALERQVSGQVQRRVSTFSSPQQAPPPSRSSSALSPRRLRIPPGFGGGVQRAQSQMRGMVRSPSKTASLFKEGVASVRRQLGINESGAIEASALRGVDENDDPRRSEGRERKKLTKRSPTVSKPSNNLKKDERDAEDNVFATNGAAVDAGVALGGLGSAGVTAQSFGVARNYNLAETAPSGSDHRVHSQRDPFVSKFNTGAATSAALIQTAVDVGPQNVSATSQVSRAIGSRDVYAGNSSRDFEPPDGRDEEDAGPISPCTTALNGLAAFGERLESGQAFISKEKREKATTVKSEGHAVKEGKGKQKAVEESVEKTEERAAEEEKIRDALKLASATAAPEANAPRTPENTRPVSAAARYPRRQKSLNQLRPRSLLEDSPSLTIFGGVVGRANRHYHTNTPRSHADRARQEVHVQDQAQAHIHPPPRGASHSHPSPPVVGRARMVDIPARSPRLRNHVPHGHPDSTPAGSPRPEGFDDLYDVTPPGTPRRRAHQSALVPASVQGSPTRGANITVAGVQIRDASNAANLFRAAPRLCPPAAPPAPQSSPVLPVPGAWPRERREASEKTIREGEEGVVEAGEVEREDHVFSSPAPGDYSLMYEM